MSLHSFISPWEEHLFWVEILQDHAIFLEEALAPEEEHWVFTARSYIRAFADLKARILSTDPQLPVTSPNMVKLAKDIYPVALGYYQLEGHMQHLRMDNQVKVDLTPVYFNGTTLENEEYLRILHYCTHGKPYEPLPLVDLMDMWLEDQLGHAVLLEHHLDPSELELVQSARQFALHFQGHIAKNQSIRGFLRFNAPNFPIQRKFAHQVAETVIAFYQLVEQVIQQFKNTELLSRLTLRFLEHHLPETCYFLRKLAGYNIAVMSLPSCPLRKPSFL